MSQNLIMQKRFILILISNKKLDYNQQIITSQPALINIKLIRNLLSRRCRIQGELLWRRVHWRRFCTFKERPHTGPEPSTLLLTGRHSRQGLEEAKALIASPIFRLKSAKIVEAHKGPRLWGAVFIQANHSHRPEREHPRRRLAELQKPHRFVPLVCPNLQVQRIHLLGAPFQNLHVTAISKAKKARDPLL